MNAKRINKSLKLFWSRTPNGTRELCSARAALRHQLGPTQTAQPPGAAKKALKWSTVKPAVDTLTRKLLESWDEKRDVLCANDRWCPAAVPDDHPSDDVVKRLQPKLNPSLCESSECSCVLTVSCASASLWQEARDELLYLYDQHAD